MGDHSFPVARRGAGAAGADRSREQVLPENVVSITSAAVPWRRCLGSRCGRSRWPRRTLLAIAATVLLTLAGATLYLKSPRNVYGTGTGEQRSILLTDGSTIDLNARSRVRVRFDDLGRHVDLVEGQALFRVAKTRDGRIHRCVNAYARACRGNGVRYQPATTQAAWSR